MDNIFSAFRLKKTSVEKLQMLKRAFELTTLQPLSNDYFIEKLMECVKENNTKVWHTYTELLSVKENAAKKAMFEK